MTTTTRREFLSTTALTLGAGATLASCAPNLPGPVRPAVAIAPAPDYGAVSGALTSALDDIGGIASLVRGRTVAIKVNLTGWGESTLGVSAGESYVVHGAVVHTLVELVLSAGATRVSIVESAAVADTLETFTSTIGWDVVGIRQLGAVEFINTRNAGKQAYATLPLPGGRLFNSVTVHAVYATADVIISVAKLKNHRSSGVTLSLKNMFGITPNALYGDGAPNEDAVGIRSLVHDRRASTAPLLPGELPVLADRPQTVRVPHAIVDCCAACPIALAVIDGIMTMVGSEGSWPGFEDDVRLVQPGVVIVGRDPVATDAVATAVMGYVDPLTASQPPFHFCLNHLALAHDAGLGIGDLARIDVRGASIEQVRTPFAWL